MPTVTASLVSALTVTTAATATTAAVTTLSVAGWAVVGVAVVGGVAAGFAMGQEQPSGIRAQNVRTPVGPRRRGYGRYSIAGNVVFMKRSVASGDGILYQAHALHTGEIDAFEEHFIGDQIARVNPVSGGVSGGGYSGITAVCFPALAEVDKPPASDVVITAYDAGYTAETVTAHYMIGATPYTLEANSVWVDSGSFWAVVFPPISSDALKPTATGVTFTNSGAGTLAAFSARANGEGKWDGGSQVIINYGGTGYMDTIGGAGVAMFANANGAGRWDGGCSPDNVAIDLAGTNFTSPTVTATWPGGSAVATSFTIGSTGLPYSHGNLIYPAIWYDNGRVTIVEHLGLASQEADPVLLAGFPGVWSQQHRLDGVAYVAIRYLGIGVESFNEVYKFGLPTYRATIRASKIWDPRDPAQNENDPTTWTWSDNAALVILDYLRHQDGMRLPASLFTGSIASWETAADYADDEITLLSGETEPRYRLWGDYAFDTDPKDVLGAFLSCVDGRLRLNEDGYVELDLGQFDCPTSCETFASPDILGVQNFRRGASKVDLRNEIRARYISRNNRLQEQESDPWRDEASILIDGQHTATLDLTYCPSHRQARQLQKVALYRLNPEWMGTIVTNAKGLRLLGKRYARFQIDDLGLDTTFFIQRADINLQTGACTFQVVSFPAEAYCWEPCEEGVSPEHRGPGNHGICVPPGATGVVMRAIGGGGGGTQNVGGGGGAYARKHIALSPADEGTVFLFTVGAAGMGMAINAFNLATNGGASTITGTVAAGVIAMTANGGLKGNSGGTGGTATGGDTNTSGQNHSSGDGGASGAGATTGESPGGGGHEQTDGGIGEVTFEFEF